MKKLAWMAILTLAFNSLVYAQSNPNAKINLALVPQNETSVSVGEEVVVRLQALAEKEDQRYVVADVIFGWDPTKLEFIGIDHSASHPLIWREFSGLPSCPPGQTTGCGDFYGLNEVLPPADGNGLYYGYNQLGSVLIVTNDTPMVIVDFVFKAIAPFTTTEVEIIPQITVNYPKETVIYGSDIPGMRVTGTFTNAIIEGTTLAGDFNGDGIVGPADLSMMMANWGVTFATDNPYDLSGDGTVNGADLAILFGNWS